MKQAEAELVKQLYDAGDISMPSTRIGIVVARGATAQAPKKSNYNNCPRKLSPRRKQKNGGAHGFSLMELSNDAFLAAARRRVVAGINTSVRIRSSQTKGGAGEAARTDYSKGSFPILTVLGNH